MTRCCRRARSTSSARSSPPAPARTPSTRSRATARAVGGWPVRVGVAAGDLLPLVLPGHDAAVLDEDGDGDDEVSVSAATGFNGRLVDGDGSDVSSYTNTAANSPDQGPVINLADYPSIGDLSGNDNPLVLKGGLTVNGAANLLAVNQNLPFSHVEQAWDPSDGSPVAGYPLATDDFQLVSQASVGRVSGSGADAPGPGRDRPLQPPRLRPRRRRGRRLAEVHRRLAAGDPGDRRRRRRRRPRRRHPHPRGLVVPVEHRRRRLRRLERGVVDLPPRRALERQLRHRRASPGLSRGPDREPRPGRRLGHLRVDRPRRRLALRHRRPLPGRSSPSPRSTSPPTARRW